MKSKVEDSKCGFRSGRNQQIFTLKQIFQEIVGVCKRFFAHVLLIWQGISSDRKKPTIKVIFVWGERKKISRVKKIVKNLFLAPTGTSIAFVTYIYDIIL